MPKRKKDIAHFTVHFIPAEEGGYSVEVPALPGCVTEGETLAEASRNVKEAIGLYVESLRARGLPVPNDRETVLKRISVPVPASTA